MGERLYLTNVKCAYCGEVQKDEVYYAPTCGDVCSTCEKCNKEFFIKTELNINIISKKLEDTTYEDIYKVTEESANFMSEDMIKDYSLELFKHIKGKLNNMEVIKMEEQENETSILPDADAETEIDTSAIESDDEDSTEEKESDDGIEESEPEEETEEETESEDTEDTEDTE